MKTDVSSVITKEVKCRVLNTNLLPKLVLKKTAILIAIKRNKPVMLIEIEERHTQKPIINTINLIKEYGYNAYILRENNKDLIDITKVNNFSNERNFFFIKK